MTIRKIREFRRLTRRFQRVTGSLLQGEPCCGGLTLSQSHVLLEIDERSDAALGDLAQALGLDKSTLSRTVDSLVDRGLVERQPKPADRRSNSHTLTPSGQQVLAEIHRVSDERVRRTFDRIPVADREQVLTSLELLVKAMGSADSCCASGDPPAGESPT